MFGESTSHSLPSQGRIIYLGYDFSEPVTGWVHALVAVRFVSSHPNRRMLRWGQKTRVNIWSLCGNVQKWHSHSESRVPMIDLEHSAPFKNHAFLFQCLALIPTDGNHPFNFSSLTCSSLSAGDAVHRLLDCVLWANSRLLPGFVL